MTNATADKITIVNRRTILPKVISEQAASPLLVTDPLKAAAHNRAGGANVHAHLVHDSLGAAHSQCQTAARSVQPFLHGRCHILPTRYITPPHFSKHVSIPVG